MGYPIMAFLLLLLVSSTSSDPNPNLSVPFPAALDALQKQLGYTFSSPALLRRAVTHPSYSRDNYRSLALLGLHSLDSSSALRRLQSDPDVAPDDLTRRISADTGSAACTVDALRLGIDRLVRVAPGTNTSAPAIVCGAFRGVFGAVALDSGKIETAGDAFRRVHRGNAVENGGIYGDA